ncbi:MAG: BolA protein [Paracoccaceae bacterium]|jgi:BolA protein
MCLFARNHFPTRSQEVTGLTLREKGQVKEMLVEKQIEAKLRKQLSPTKLEVVDESAQHRGHAGAPEEGQSHFRIRITAPSLDGLSRIARHRAIHTAVGNDLIDKIHALAIEVAS